MTYIPKCRTDENYNQKYLDENDMHFVEGFDWAVKEMVNLFGNLDVYPELEEILDDKKAIIVEGKAKIAEEALSDWMESERDELITSMIDSYGCEKYDEIKARVDSNENV